jgi:NAD kinase
VTLVPRVVVITRPTPYEELLARHATRSQAEFFLRQRGETLAGVEAVHHRIRGAVALVQAAIPLDWRRNVVLRADLDRFLFEPEDTIVVIGQDGLVANVAKYLDGQRVVGVNPTPDLFDGVLVAHSPEAGARLLEPVARGEVRPEARVMVEAELDDGQRLCALNELFLGHRTHQSARYEIALESETAMHSSSGIVVATGTGATGWARSISLERHSSARLPLPTDARLAFFVREAFPSIATSTELTEGGLEEGAALHVTSRMEEGVIFGDGMERDYLRFEWGVRAEVRVAKRRLMLIGVR